MSDHLLWVVPIQFSYVTQQVPAQALLVTSEHSAIGDCLGLSCRAVWRKYLLMMATCIPSVQWNDIYSAVVPLPERNYENYDGGWRIWRIVMVNWAEWHNLHSGSEYWIVMRKTLLHSTNYYIIHKYYLGKPSKKVISKISLRSLIFLMYNKSMSPLPLQLECVSMSAAELELEILICWVI